MAQSSNAHLMDAHGDGMPDGPKTARPDNYKLTSTVGEAGDNAGNNAFLWEPIVTTPTARAGITAH